MNPLGCTADARIDIVTAYFSREAGDGSAICGEFMGVIAYTSFEDVTVAGGIGISPHVLPDSASDGAVHMLSSGFEQNPLNHTAAFGHTEIGFQCYYQAAFGTFGFISADAYNSPGRTIGVVGDATTSMGGGGGGTAPDGAQYLLLQDSGSFVWASMDAVDVLEYTSVSCTYWVNLMAARWESNDFMKAWMTDQTGADAVFLQASGGLIDDFGHNLAPAYPEGRWIEHGFALVGLVNRVELKFGLASVGSVLLWYDYVRLSGVGPKPPTSGVIAYTSFEEPTTSQGTQSSAILLDIVDADTTHELMNNVGQNPVEWSPTCGDELGDS